MAFFKAKSSTEQTIKSLEKSIDASRKRRKELDENFPDLALAVAEETAGAEERYRHAVADIEKSKVDEDAWSRALAIAQRQLDEERRTKLAADQAAHKKRGIAELEKLPPLAADLTRHLEAAATVAAELLDRYDRLKQSHRVNLSDLVGDVQRECQRLGLVGPFGSNSLGEPFQKAVPKFVRNRAWHTEEYADEQQAELERGQKPKKYPALAEVIRSGNAILDAPPEPDLLQAAPSPKPVADGRLWKSVPDPVTGFRMIEVESPPTVPAAQATQTPFPKEAIPVGPKRSAADVMRTLPPTRKEVIDNRRL